MITMETDLKKDNILNSKNDTAHEFNDAMVSLYLTSLYSHIAELN